MKTSKGASTIDTSRCCKRTTSDKKLNLTRTPTRVQQLKQGEEGTGVTPRGILTLDIQVSSHGRGRKAQVIVASLEDG